MDLLFSARCTGVLWVSSDVGTRVSRLVPSKTLAVLFITSSLCVLRVVLSRRPALRSCTDAQRTPCISGAQRDAVHFRLSWLRGVVPWGSEPFLAKSDE